MTLPSEAPIPALPTYDGVVVAELPCRKCSYNLLGLSAAGRCPECGTPVEFSVGGELLRYADPQWLEKMRRGIRLVLIGMGVTVVSGVVAVALAVSAGRGRRPDAAVTTLIALMSNVLMVWGSWWLTTPDPSGIGEKRYGKARQVVRVGLLVGVGKEVMQLPISWGTVRPDVVLVLTWVGQVAGLFTIAGSLARFHYLQHLALRIPDPRLSGRARFLKIGFGICFGLYTLFEVATVGRSGASGLAGGALGKVNGLGPMLAAVFTLCAVGAALLVFSILDVVLLIKFASRLAEQAAYARTIWNRTAAPT